MKPADVWVIRLTAEQIDKLASGKHLEFRAIGHTIRLVAPKAMEAK
jgi:hypothetical protein